MPNYKQLGNDFFIGPEPSEQDLNEASKQGIRTVIDFRMPFESAGTTADLTRKSGLDYVRIPVDKTALSKQQINDLEKALENNTGPYLLHCATGMRAAMLLALSRAKQNGWSAERTFQEADSMGFDLRGSPDFAAFVRRITSE